MNGLTNQSAGKLGARLALPEAPLLLATILLVHLPSLRGVLVSFGRFYPIAAFALGLFLALRYSRGRLLFSLAVLALATWGPLAASLAGRQMAFDAATLLVPLNLLVFALLPDRGAFTPSGWRRWGVILGEGVVVGVLAKTGPLSGDAFFRASLLAPGIVQMVGLPAPAILAFVLAFAMLAVLTIREPDGPGRGGLWGLVACGIALTMGKPSVGATVAFSTAAVVLSVAIIETSYHQVYHDALTGLPGRRALDEELLKLGEQYVVAMVDVDHFKKFNDTFGHDVGDEVLKMVATRLATVARGGKAYRYGGEEFSILFSGVSAAEATPALEAVREAVADTEFTVRKRLRPRRKPSPVPVRERSRHSVITVSIGVAEPGGRNKTPDQVLQAADRALYQAKEQGRNRVVGP
ncbi:MAG TPA: GGDEF domain-containing protein [Gemmatimonadales bacterium]|nr:GGDEF domain-containing protein [Gemmatimonadales bacterium]